MTLRPTPDNRPPATVDEVRRAVLLGRAVNTQPESVDGLLRLADLALANAEVIL